MLYLNLLVLLAPLRSVQFSSNRPKPSPHMPHAPEHGNMQHHQGCSTLTPFPSRLHPQSDGKCLAPARHKCVLALSGKMQAPRAPSQTSTMPCHAIPCQAKTHCPRHQQTAIASPSTIHGARECHYFACPRLGVLLL